MKRPQALAALMESVFRGTPAEKRLREGKIWLVWESAVGEQIAARAKPVRFAGGVLTVMVASAPWMQQLNFLKKTIVEKLNHALGEPLVTDIYLKAGKPESPKAPVPPPPVRRPAPLSPQAQERIAAETADIHDPELRAAFTSLFKRHLSGK